MTFQQAEKSVFVWGDDHDELASSLHAPFFRHCRATTWESPCGALFASRDQRLTPTYRRMPAYTIMIAGQLRHLPHRLLPDKAVGTHPMKTIAPLAVITIVLLQFSGAIPQSSVGGSLTIGFVFLAFALAVGIHEAWTNKRGVLGWIVSMLTALVGGFVAAGVFGDILIVPVLALLNLIGSNLEGSLAATGGPLLYAALAGMMLLTLLGSWAALQLVNRWR